MSTEKQTARRERVQDAAYAVLQEVGYKGASMLAIARRASASNETLYKWYGSKQALFRSLVEANAREARELLEGALRQGSSPIETLSALGPVILSLVTGEKAVVLNRAAASDVSDTGTLGRSIAEAGRDTIAPLLRDLLDRARRAGLIQCDDPATAVEVYLGLLIGDLQIRRVIGVLEEPSPKEIGRRSQRAFDLFLRLHAPGRAPRTRSKSHRNPS